MIIWMDEPNINLFCRSHGRARVGDRAVMLLPTSQRPNVHVVCAISAYQTIPSAGRRGGFKSNTAKTWVLEMLQNLLAGVSVDFVVLVCDNALCHSKFEECVNDYPG